MRWSEIKRELQTLDQAGVLRVIKGLHDISPENKRFLQAALHSEDQSQIDEYRSQIEAAVNPDVRTPIDLQRGRRAITEYSKAVPNDLKGHLDLMMQYVESGASQTLTYGDIDERFYDSMCSMIDRILKRAEKLGESDLKAIVNRFESLDESTRNRIGWGYSDHISGATDDIRSLLAAKG